MGISVQAAPPPPVKLHDDVDDTAAAQANAAPPPAANPTAVAPPPADSAASPISASSTATPTPTPQGSAPTGAVPTPPPLPGAPAAAAPAAPATPSLGDGFVDNKLKPIDQAKPGEDLNYQEIAPLSKAQTAYSDASSKVAELNKQLDTQLKELDPGLKDQSQRDAYTAQFHQKYAAEYGAQAAAATTLATAVKDPRNDFVAATSPAAAGQVAAAVKTLATSSEAATASSWMASKFGAGAPAEAGAPYRPFFSDDAIVDTEGDVALSEAGSGSFTQLTKDMQSLSNSAIGGSALAAKLKPGAELIKSLADAQASVPPTDPNAAPGRHEAGDMHQGGSAQVAAPTGQTAVGADNKHVAPQVFKEAYEKGAGPKFEAASYLAAAYLVAQGPGEAKPEQTEYLGQVALAAQGGVTATNATAEQLSQVKAFQKYAGQAIVDSVDTLRAARPALEVAGRALGGLAGAAFGIADVEKAFDEGGNGFRIAAAVGDFASVAVAIDGLAPWGLVGIGVGAVANKLADEAVDNTRHDEEADLMGKAGIVDPAVADTIAHHPQAVASIAGAGELDGGQIQSLAKTNPELFKTDDGADAFAQVTKAAGLKGDDVLGFAAALAQGPLGRGAPTQLAQDLKGGVDGKPYSASWLVDHVANHGTFPGAAAFLNQHAPKMVAESAARAEADSQFDSVLGEPISTGSAFSYGLARQNDPVYRAQFIKDADEKGLLADAVSSRSDAPVAEKAALVRALHDAANDGGISDDEANRYIAELA